MVKFVLTSALIFAVMVAWLYVQDLYRRFALRHPELGPFRQDGGCGGSCSCSQGDCPTATSTQRPPGIAIDLIERDARQE